MENEEKGTKLDVTQIGLTESCHCLNEVTALLLPTLALLLGVIIQIAAAKYGLQRIVNALHFIAQMIFFLACVGPTRGSLSMILLNTAANLGGAWPSSFIMHLVEQLSLSGVEECSGGRDTYFPLPLIFCVLR
eukprot:4012469-Ditylum_brightwellii.AAC.1